MFLGAGIRLHDEVELASSATAEKILRLVEVTSPFGSEVRVSGRREKIESQDADFFIISCCSSFTNSSLGISLI